MDKNKENKNGALAENENKPVKKDRKVLKHGAYAAAFTALFVAGVIALNVIATVLAGRFPLNIDLTASKLYTITEENKEYIRNIDKDVNIIVCAEEEDFGSGYYAEMIYYNTGLQDSTGGKYFTQMVEFLNMYAKLSDHINLQYIDAQKPEFTNISKKYPGENISYGSIVVESAYTASDGSTAYNHRVLAFADLFEYISDYYYISGSKVESTLTSAIYSVISEVTEKVVILSGHNAGSTEDVENLLTSNNYEVATIENLLTEELPEDITALIIAAPTTDYSSEEISILDDYLKSSSKTLIYFADASQPPLPALEEYLEEWGFGMQAGTVIATADNEYYQQPNIVLGTSTGSEYTTTLDNQSYIYLCGNNRPINLIFESQNNFTTTSLVQFSDTTVAYPSDAGEDWKPEQGKSGPYEMVSISRYSKGDVDSSMIMLSSLDILNGDWAAYNDIANREVILKSLGQLSGREESDNIVFTSKTISTTSYADKITAEASFILFIVCVVILPLAVIALGVIIWVRRKRL